MSPREKYIPDDAHRTSICLTAEDRAAVRWMYEIRRAKGDRRTTTNDILIDALWFLVEKGEGIPREQVRASMPVIQASQRTRDNVAEMPKGGKK